MLKREANEIKRLYDKDNCSVSRIVGCYVDGEHNIRTKFSEVFLSLPEEVIYKYLSIFKKTLSGTMDKNMLSVDFPSDTESDGGTQNQLLKLRNSALKDEDLLAKYYERIISVYQYVGNYLILLIHNVYDIPGKMSDNIQIEDASEEVFDYISCMICPVALSKPGLSFNMETTKFENRALDWVVGMPEVSFMFPAFNDRSTDIHAALYYEKKPEMEHSEILTEILGCKHKISSVEQKKAFDSFLGESGCSISDVKNIHGKLFDMMVEHKEVTSESLILDKDQIMDIIQECVTDEKILNKLDAAYDRSVGRKTDLIAENITDKKKMEIKSPDIRIKLAPDRGELLKERIVDGKKCLVIDIGSDVEINGVRVNR